MRTGWAALGAVGLAAIALPDPAWAETRRYALLAAANDGGGQRATLRYAVTDALAMEQVLTELGGVDPADVRLVIEPDVQGLSDALDGMRATLADAGAQGLRTEVVVYYSGHSDETGLLLGEQRFPYDQLRAAIEGLGADVQVVVLDSCASGAMVRSKGGVHRPAFLEDRSNDVEGTAYLLSASAAEAAQESDAIGASYFTHYLVSGLRGGADRENDGRVTLTEAYQYASAETLRRTERTQIGPQHALFAMNMLGHGGFVFTDLTRTPSSLVFDRALTGRLFVRDAEGRLVAELDQAGEQALDLAVRAGLYRVVRERDGARDEAEVTIGASEHVLVDPAMFRALATEVAVARGSAGAPAPGPSAARVGQPAAQVNALPPADAEHSVAELHVFARRPHVDYQVGFLGAKARWVGALQAGGAYSWADTVRGAQLGFGLNRALDLQGAQLTLLGANVTEGDSVALQLGWLNHAGARLEGVQVGLVNHARGLDGFQLGLINAAGGSRGFQLGLINAGGDGGGLQVGLINVAGDYDGVAVGLITVHRRGYNHVAAGASSLDPASLGLTWGSRRLYTHLQLGAWGYGGASGVLGLGLHIPAGERVYVDVDVGGGVRGEGLLPVARARAQLGVALLPRLALQTGPVLELQRAEERWDEPPSAWLGWGGGVRF